MARASDRYIAIIEEAFDTDGLSGTIDDAAIIAQTAFSGMGGTGASITFPHYTELARSSKDVPMPYRGAYCARFTLVAGDGVTDTFLEDTLADAIDNDYQSVRFYFYLSPDFTMANNDEFRLLELDSAAAVEATVTIGFTTAGGLVIGWGKIASTNEQTITTGVWHSVEILLLLDTGGAGTLDFFLDDVAGAQITTLTGAAVTDLELGVQGRESGTSGTIYIDQYVLGTSTTTARRIYGLSKRWPELMHIGSSQQICVGSGVLDGVSLTGALGSADHELILYDTDTASFRDASRILMPPLKTTAQGEVVDSAVAPITFSRGVYADLTTDANGLTYLARASIKIKHCSGYGSEAVMRNHASKRLPSPRGY